MVAPPILEWRRIRDPASSPAWPRNNVLTLIAGIGVLLLAMGVGVLIGRSGGSGTAGTPAPQVITLGGAGVAGRRRRDHADDDYSGRTDAYNYNRIESSAEKGESQLAPGVGSVPSKPAPPSVLKNLRKKSNGDSYEQKSKNLPNVVETG